MSVELEKFLGVAGLALTVIALLLAFYQTWDARKQAQRLKSHSASLRMIADSLSTRYLGPFPDYLSAVTNLVESSVKELCIVNTIPTPAYFSAPSLWLPYRHAIERKVRAGVSMHLVCMNESQRQKRTAKQFPSSRKEWDCWIVTNRDKVVEFLRFRYPDVKLDKLDHAKFLELLLATQRDLLGEMFRGVEIREVDQVVSLQIWIADKSRAIFSIQTLAPNGQSHGLFTSDALFVTALRSMMNLYDSSGTS